MQHYLIICIGMVDPEVVAGSFDNNDDLIAGARKIVAEEKFKLGEYGEDALFWLDIDEDGKPVIGSFDTFFMEVCRQQITESEQRVLDGNR